MGLGISLGRVRLGQGLITFPAPEGKSLAVQSIRTCFALAQIGMLLVNNDNRLPFQSVIGRD
jgi:hypothetical protein